MNKIEMNTIIAFDDTGSSQKTKSRTLETSRKTYVGVILTSDQAVLLNNVIQDILSQIKSDLGPTEFHFVDILNGNGEWENVEDETRLQIFEGMCDIFSEFSIPCVVNTWSPNHYKKNNISIKEIPNLEFFDKSNYEHFAFYIALLKSVKYVCQNNLVPVTIFCDEGMKRAGSTVELSILKNIAESSAIHFESSARNIYLQIADFAAYCFNRQQMFINKDVKSSTDIRIMRSIEKLGFHYMDVEYIRANLKQLDSEIYDYIATLKHKDVHG